VALRVPLSYLLVELSKTPAQPLGQSEMIYYAVLATWMAGALINYLAYRYGRWRRRAQERMDSLDAQSREAAAEFAAMDSV
ncbi:MAG TPA: hypothetical protein PLR12_06910, partial [Clostridia bacterium]|nr:hypothetical protein [Clostridia bacterium]